MSDAALALVRFVRWCADAARGKARLDQHLLRWEIRELRERLSRTEASHGMVSRKAAALESMVSPARLALSTIVAGSSDPYEDAVKGLAALAEIEARTEQVREVN